MKLVDDIMGHESTGWVNPQAWGKNSISFEVCILEKSNVSCTVLLLLLDPHEFERTLDTVARPGGILNIPQCHVIAESSQQNLASPVFLIRKAGLLQQRFPKK